MSYVLIGMFVFHAFFIHGLTESLVYCFEEDGQVVLESQVQSIFAIPAEHELHNEAKTLHHSDQAASYATQPSHHDVSVSAICWKVNNVLHFNQVKTQQILDEILNTVIDELSQDRIFHFDSYFLPLIEDLVTSNLQTVVLLN